MNTEQSLASPTAPNAGAGTAGMLARIGIDHDQMLDRRETAAMLTRCGFRTSAQALANLAATTSTGPLYSIYLGRALYCAGATLDWAKARASKPRRCSSNLAAA